MIVDEVDLNRSKVYALIYHTASVHEGIVRLHPDIHGIYETWHAAEEARKTKLNPKDYYNIGGYWRKS